MEWIIPAPRGEGPGEFIRRLVLVCHPPFSRPPAPAAAAEAEAVITSAVYSSTTRRERRRHSTCTLQHASHATEYIYSSLHDCDIIVNLRRPRRRPDAGLHDDAIRYFDNHTPTVF